MKQIIFSIVALLFIALLQSNKTLACSCAPPGSPAEEVQRNEVVFVGSTDNIFTYSSAPRTSGSDLLENAFYTHRTLRTFTVHQNIKGLEDIKSILLEDFNTSCSYDFKDGRNYIIYGSYSENTSGAISTSICSRTSLQSIAFPDNEYFTILNPNYTVIDENLGAIDSNSLSELQKRKIMFTVFVLLVICGLYLFYKRKS